MSDALPARPGGWLAALTFVPGHVLAWLPRRALLALGSVLGWTWFHVVPVRRRWVLAHLRAAWPQAQSEAARRSLARRVFVEQARNVLELLAWRRLLRRGAVRVRVEGAEHLRAARRSGRATLVLTAHCGNFDLAACHHALSSGESLVVVSKRLSWRALDRLWMATRGRLGVHAVDAQATLGAALRALREGRLVAMVLDQHSPERRAVELPFLGLPARTSAALATLALRADASVVPCFAHRDGDGQHVVRFEAPLALPAAGTPRQRVVELTRLGLERVEAAVRRHPESWLWLHRRWKTADGSPIVRRW